VPHLRWTICGLLFFATSINYVDRQVISILKPHLEEIFHWSESDYGWIVFAFQMSYALMQMVSGRVMDRLGTRVGYALAMVWWSLAGMAHVAARGVFSFGVARFFLGAGEGGNFPAAIKGVAEWFPARERALATGLFNAGSSLGTMSPPVIVWITLTWGWRAAFLFTGGLGFVWLIFWLLIYWVPAQHPWITQKELAVIESDRPAAQEEREPSIPWRVVVKYRQVWGLIIARFMTDPIWWFYVFWLPSYLKAGRGFSLQMIGYFAWIPFLVAGFGGVAGGWLSGFLLKRGWPVGRARKGAMAICALSMPAGIAAVFAPNAWLSLIFISVATSAHQGWAANIFTLTSDIFPKKAVGSVVGLAGSGGAAGGMILALTAGYVLHWFHTYVPLFIIAGVMHPLGLAVLFGLIPKVAPVGTPVTS
jgi:ACS family hexuronate transporter-like MFS transporter